MLNRDSNIAKTVEKLQSLNKMKREKYLKALYKREMEEKWKAKVLAAKMDKKFEAVN